MYSGFVNTEKDFLMYVFKLFSIKFLRSPFGSNSPNVFLVSINSLFKFLAVSCSCLGSCGSFNCPFKYART